MMAVKRPLLSDYDKGNPLYVPPHYVMPQTTNMKVRQDMDLSPVGPGTVFNKMVAISAATRDRAFLVNKTEEIRLEKIRKMIEKDFRSRELIQKRSIEKTTKTLKELQAMRNLFDWDYKVDNFVTMKAGFDSDSINTKHMARRYIIESRVFNSGFNMKALKPEVNRRLRKMDPNQKYRVFKKKLLEQNKEISGAEINRTITKSAFHRMLADKDNWRKHNFPPTPKWMQSIYTGEPVEGPSVKQETDANQFNVDGVTENKDIDLDETEIADQRTKRLILERRKSKRPDAFGMTMRTLGPVYFQSSVSQQDQRRDIEVKEA